MRGARWRFPLLLLAVLPAPAAPPTTAAAAGYHLVAHATLGGEGGWDYLTVDPATRRLYVTRSSHVLVADADRLELLGDIPGTPGVHGVVLVPEIGRGFTSNGRDTSVTIFDLKTLGVLSRVVVGPRPDAIVYDPVSKRVFTMNASGSATAIDAASGRVAGTVPLGTKPEAAVCDGRGRLYVNLEDSSQVAVVDTRSLAVLARWPLAPGEHPSGLAIDTASARLFSGCENRTLVVMDATNGKIVTKLPIGGNVDGVAFDPEKKLAFASNGEGTLTLVAERGPSKFEVVANVPTARGARTLALDPRTHRVYVVTAQFGPATAPTPEQPRPRPSIVPGTFEVRVYGE